MLRALLLGAFILLTSVSVHATHIVGGSLHYNCLGNDKYEVILTVYTDCLLGQAPYDDPAWIAVFDGDGIPVDTFLMHLGTKIDTIELTDPCFLALPDICVRVTQYKEVITLPFNPGGYYITYQRCCRNATIQNIIDPLKTGATYFSFIGEQAQLECNSAPAFKKWPPIFVCANEPLVVDNGAIDPDGDSLVYELFTPYTGGVYITNPQPKPPFPPPYEEVTWKTPPYDLSNLTNGLPGGIPLTINPKTGVMTGKPNTIGQFVVGVRINEYRNGVLIGQRFRDFQYNVVPCIITKAIIELADTVQCDDYQVAFGNTSTNANSYFWDFGDPTTTTDTSSSFEPFYTYPDSTGFYTVMLIAKAGDFCSDTTFQTIFLQKNSIDPGMEVLVPLCEDSLVVWFNDTSTDSISPIVKWNWTITPDNNPIIQFSNEQNQWTFPSTTSAIVNLKVESANGCKATLIDTFQLNILEVPDLISDTLNLCYLETTFLNPNFDPNLFYTWSPPDGILGSLTEPNPEIQVTKTTNYTVAVTDSTGLCIVEKTANLMAIGLLPEISLVVEIPSCTDSIVLATTLDSIPPDITICWTVTKPNGVVDTVANSIKLVLKESALLYICATIKTDSCESTLCDTVQVNLIPRPNLKDTLQICQGDSVNLHPGAIPYLVYSWTPVTGLDDPTSPNPKASPEVTTLYTLLLTDTIGLCELEDQILVVVNDSTKILDFTWDVYCDGLMVDFINESENINQFHWNFGDPNTTLDVSDLENPSYTYPGVGTYPVMLWTDDTGVCPQNDTLIKDLVLVEPVNEASFTYDFTICGNPTEIQFYGMSESTYGVVTSWQWIFGGLGMSIEQNPVLIVNESQTIDVTLIVVWDDKCSDTITQTIEVEVIELDIPEILTLCQDSCIQIISGGDPAWVYSWSPENWIVEGGDGPNPLVCPDSNGTLFVEVMAIQSNGDTCLLLDEMVIQIDPCEFPCDLIDEVVTCLDTICVTVDDCDDMVELVWCSPDGDTLGTGPTICFPTEVWDFVLVKKIGPFGFMEMDTIFIEHLFYEIPVVAISDPYEILMGESSQLIGTTPAIVNYVWTPPQTLDDPFSSMPIATPDTTTIYTLKVTDALGCMGQDTTIVYVRTKVCEEPYIFIPNTFTPNGDNVNDVLYVRGFYIDEMELQIFNRWGELVFRSTDKSQGWDGMYKGERLRTDVYGYWLKIRCFGGEEFFKKGNVTLLRQ
ncbi:MAG: gliding motility-associated C-terminal domain-containing protein [Saprospiraceae bacterium]|nr:gliding motility-associated C-terminal domain-containing protein [Saprospiraceae bacterium]